MQSKFLLNPICAIYACLPDVALTLQFLTFHICNQMCDPYYELCIRCLFHKDHPWVINFGFKAPFSLWKKLAPLIAKLQGHIDFLPPDRYPRAALVAFLMKVLHHPFVIKFWPHRTSIKTPQTICWKCCWDQKHNPFETTQVNPIITQLLNYKVT